MQTETVASEWVPSTNHFFEFLKHYMGKRQLVMIFLSAEGGGEH